MGQANKPFRAVHKGEEEQEVYHERGNPSGVLSGKGSMQLRK